jgi:hypothetical protein
MARERMYVDAAESALELGVPSRDVPDAVASAVAWYRERGYAA